MTNSVSMPLWLLLLVLFFAALALLHLFLLPSVRWFMRRRANRVIDEVNERLALQLPSFKLTKRQVLIDRLTYHPEVMQQVEAYASENQMPRDAVMEKVLRYAHEIVPAFNAYLYFKWAYWLARRIVHMLYRVRLGFADDASLSTLGPKSSVVFVMNHRSNMDYVVATYLAAERTALSYAVGEWARVWPLQQLIRAMGGYFVRRDSGDPLYRKVLQIYVQMAAEGGVPQAVFPEGKLSRNGRLGEPKLGLLGYITRDFNPEGERDIVFIPVGINYDRVLEDRTLLRALNRSDGKATTFFTVKTTLRFIFSNIGKALIGRWYRFGYACVNFGRPVSLKEWLLTRKQPTNEEQWQASVSELGSDLMQRIGDITPILPVALTATVFRQVPDANMSELDLKIRVAELIDVLKARGAHVYIPRANMDYAVNVGLRMLTLRHILIKDEVDGYYSANPDELQLLDFYAASIAHLVPADWTNESTIIKEGDTHYAPTT